MLQALRHAAPFPMRECQNQGRNTTRNTLGVMLQFYTQPTVTRTHFQLVMLTFYYTMLYPPACSFLSSFDPEPRAAPRNCSPAVTKIALLFFLSTCNRIIFMLCFIGGGPLIPGLILAI